MKPTSYMVGYKDSTKAPPRYFGTFVSERVAEFFIAALPKPRKGGWAKTVPVQPFTAQEAHIVSELITRERH